MILNISEEKDGTEMQELIRSLIEALVDNPQDIDLQVVEGEKTVVFELKLNESDVGKVIGKKGKTINAIRTLLKAIVTKDNKKVMLELLQ